MIPIYIGSHNLVEIRNMKNVATGERIIDATCKMTLVDEQSAPIAGAIDIQLSCVDGPSGRYAGMIPSTIALVSGKKYSLQITTVAGDLVRLDRVPVRARYAEGM